MKLPILMLLLTLSACLEACSGYLLPFLKSLKGYSYRNYGGYSYGGYGGGYGYRDRSSRYRSGRAGGGRRAGRTYTDIASVINGNPYASVGSNPFPAQPFWPYG